MFSTMTEIEQDDMLIRMHDKLEAASRLIELDRQLSEGLEIDEQQLDDQFATCVDLVMADETDWI